jgi:hypothetical protein
VATCGLPARQIDDVAEQPSYGRPQDVKNTEGTHKFRTSARRR